MTTMTVRSSRKQASTAVCLRWGIRARLLMTLVESFTFIILPHSPSSPDVTDHDAFAEAPYFEPGIEAPSSPSRVELATSAPLPFSEDLCALSARVNRDLGIGGGFFDPPLIWAAWSTVPVREDLDGGGVGKAQPLVLMLETENAV
jgi:hypothetical protein